MGAKEAMRARMAKRGVKIISLGPLGPNLSEAEFIKWLNYIPESQRQRTNYLLNKRVSELTKKAGLSIKEECCYET